MFNFKFSKELTKVGCLALPALSKYLVGIFTVITIIAVFVPLNPGMPHSGLDPSWVLSMNQAVAQNLKIGEDIIFTFGPYVSVYTRSYHPATDHLMVFGSLFLGVCYVLALLYLANDKKPYYLLAFLFFLAGFLYARDPLFFSYPLILAVCATRYVSDAEKHKKTSANTWQLLAIALFFMPFGLLPLIKGSFLLICGTTTIAIFSYFLYHRQSQLALISLISPIVSTIIFWSVSGQSIVDLPSFFISMAPIISGYTEAMALPGKNKEIIVFMITAIAILWVLLKSNKTTVPTKILLSICFALFLFIAFKASFVRHDGHGIIAGISLIFATLIIGILYADKRLMIVLLISIISLVYITNNYRDTSIKQVLHKTLNTYVSTYDGLRSRLSESNKLKNRFERSLAGIRKIHAVPALQGTTDIYSYDQAYLLASNNKWNPRPIIQSYSAYMPKLAKLNEQHLRNNSAPDNVLFRVQPIDGRLPSLEDGLSWPALFDNYTLAKPGDELVYFSKKKTIKSSSAFDVIFEGEGKIGEDFILPISSDPIYAEIDLKPTLVGKFLGLVYKPPQLKLTLNLKSGEKKDYRVISKMMQSGFFMSPLIKNTKDFEFLATGNHRYLSNKVVERIAITPAYGGSIFWNDAYTLKLKAYRGEAASSVLEIFNASLFDSTPAGYSVSDPIKCDGTIDVVNGWHPVPSSMKITKVLSVSGWLAVSAKGGVGVDDVFVTLKKSGEAIKYIKAKRTSRNDVKKHFKQPAMPDIGYEFIVDVSALKGQYILSLSRGYKGKLEQCQLFKTITIGTVN
jgi:hypothetical protein